MLFMASIMFMVGHVFLLTPQMAQASTSSPSNVLVHHDTAEHDAEKHNPCPTELHELSYVRIQEVSPDLCDFTLTNVYFEIFDSLFTPLVSVDIIPDESLPARLPLAQKTHLRI